MLSRALRSFRSFPPVRRAGTPSRTTVAMHASPAKHGADGRGDQPPPHPAVKPEKEDESERAADAPPASPGSLYEAERAARIAANEARMAAIVGPFPNELKTGKAADDRPPAARSAGAKRKKKAADDDGGGEAPPLRRSTRDRRPGAARGGGGARSRRRHPCVDEDDDDEEEEENVEEGDGWQDPLTAEERLARVAGREGGWEEAAAGATWGAGCGGGKAKKKPALAEAGKSTSRPLLADAAAVRELNQYRAATMTTRAIANRIDKLTNLTKLADFIPVLRSKAVAALAEGRAADAVEYDRLADVAEAKLERLQGEDSD